jgi:hypothetical protein
MPKKKFSNFEFSKNYKTFYPQNCHKVHENIVWDLRSGIGKNLFRIPDPWVKKAQDPGSGSATQQLLGLKYLCLASQEFCKLLELFVPSVAQLCK